jgi:probable addiction module antidote protein
LGFGSGNLDSIFSEDDKMKRKDYYQGLLENLTDEAQAAAYLDAALEDKDIQVFLLALRNVALAQGGIQALAQKTRLHRVNLNRILSEKGNPELQSLSSIFQELGFRLRVEAIARRKPQQSPKKKLAAKGLGLGIKKTTQKVVSHK